MFTGNLDTRLDRLSAALGPCDPNSPRHWAIVQTYRRLLEAEYLTPAMSAAERREAKLAAAVERATAKLTVLEYNALALHIRAQVLADLDAIERN